MRNAIILQQTSDSIPDFAPHLRLTGPVHQAYANFHRTDYRYLASDYDLTRYDPRGGAWDKILMIIDALNEGYEYITWVDADALIKNNNVDLRDVWVGLPDAVGIAACQHPGPPVHLNVGVLYIRSLPQVKAFMTEWLSMYEQRSKMRWMEQGAFNYLAVQERYAGLVMRVHDRWNATIGITEVDNPVVLGFHGPYPPQIKYNMLRAHVPRREVI